MATGCLVVTTVTTRGHNGHNGHNPVGWRSRHHEYRRHKYRQRGVERRRVKAGQLYLTTEV
eukprot:scaffold1236_cov138-Skeletonema_marinoi.AAC.11